MIIRDWDLVIYFWSAQRTVVVAAKEAALQIFTLT